MATYIIRRVIQGIIVLWAATLLIYSILVITPGGPKDQVAAAAVSQGRSGNAKLAESLLKQYKLDSPYPISYLRWLFDPQDTIALDPDTNDPIQKGIDVNLFGWNIKGSGVLTFDFGTSVTVARGRNVMTLMGGRLGNTLALTTSSLLLSILIALPIGILSAIRQYSKLDYAVTGFSFVGLSMPTFWFGLMLIVFLGVFAKQLHEGGWTWLPYFSTGTAYDVDQQNNIINRIYHLILPVTVLSLVNVAQYSRYVRASMLEVLRQDYVRTAWAKGLSQRTVILRHALRNALIPVITVITLSLPFLFSGAIATETIFRYPGMGQLYITAVTSVDLPLAMSFLLIITALIIFSNLLADVLYAVADPRIHYS
jgi:peptide/nickel transport system permease protein